MDETLGLLRQHYPVVASKLLRPVLEVLTVGRAHLDGDADTFIVLLTIVLRTVEHERFAQLKYEDLAALDGKDLPSLGINLRSISDSTGIPRETVRRKVSLLVDAGLVARDRGELMCTPAAFRELEPVRESVLKLAARHARVVARIMRQYCLPAD